MKALNLGLLLTIYMFFGPIVLADAADVVRKAAPSSGEQLRFKVNDTAASFVDRLGLQSNIQKLQIFRVASKAAEDALEVPKENRISELIPRLSMDESSISRDETYVANTLYLAQLKVIGGGDVKPNDPDFMNCVAIGWGNQNGPRFKCTGTLIADNLVLTAGHCQEEYGKPRWVFFGDDTTRKGNIVGVVSCFSCDSADLLLLVLADRVSSVRPCRLASSQVPPGFPSQQTGPFRSVTVVGFGATDAAGKTGAGKKRLGIVGVCGDFPDRYGYEKGLEFAAGKRGEPDTCLGDSGGPAYVLIGGNPILLGCTSRPIQSHVATCGDGGIYVRADRQLSWISRIAKSNGSNLP